MKAILIDPYAETITPVEFNGDINEIYRLCDYQIFTVVSVEPNRDGIFVDDEGLLTLTDETKFFTYAGYPQPLAGKGLILGLNPKTGNSVSVKTPLDVVKSKVKFYTLAQVRSMPDV